MLLAINRKARAVVGRGKEGPVCDPGCEVVLGGRGESSARIINGIKKNADLKTSTKKVGLRHV